MSYTYRTNCHCLSLISHTTVHRIHLPSLPIAVPNFPHLYDLPAYSTVSFTYPPSHIAIARIVDGQP